MTRISFILKSCFPRRTLLAGLLTGLFGLLAGRPNAHAQPGYQVSVSPGGPVALPTNGSQVLTATALRPSFNIGGSGCGSGSVTAMTMQPDGKILAVGGFLRYNNDPATPRGLIRLTPDGLRDPTFNVGGTGFGGGLGQTFVTALQPDGKIVVGGNFTTYNGAFVSAGLVRLNPNGSLDSSFNPGGTGVTGTSTHTARALAVQPDGKILVGGSFDTYNGSPTPQLLMRLTADGSLDPSFTGATTGFSPAYGAVFSLLLQPNGRIVVGGWFNDYNELAINGSISQPRNILRLLANGALDYSFNPARSGFNEDVRALALQPDGSIVVGGDFSTYNYAAIPRGLARLSASGALDASFNAGGTGLSNQASNVFLVNNVAVQPDGKILAAGNCTAYNGSAAITDHIVRVNANGTPDLGFNAGGAGFDSFAWSLALQADGRIAVGGNFVMHNGNYITPFLTRLNADGSLNATAEPAAGATYAWSTGATTPTLTVTTAGTYSVTVTAGGYAVQSGPVVVSGGALASRATGPLAAFASVYPNPAHGTATLEFSAGSGARELTGTLYSSLGQAVRTFSPAPLPAAGRRIALDVQGLAPGLYSLRLTADGHFSSHPLVVK